MKRIYIDCETTGLDPMKHGLVQVAGIIEINGKEKETLNLFLRPFEDDEINQDALDVHHLTIEEINTYPMPIDAYRLFTNTLKKYVDPFNKKDKFQWVGYNAQFDTSFVRRWFDKCGDPYFGSWFWNPPLDVMHVANFLVNGRRPYLENFKLATVAKDFGVSVEEKDAHNALYDITITKQILERIEASLQRNLEGASHV